MLASIEKIYSLYPSLQYLYLKDKFSLSTALKVAKAIQLTDELLVPYEKIRLDIVKKYFESDGQLKKDINQEEAKSKVEEFNSLTSSEQVEFSLKPYTLSNNDFNDMDMSVTRLLPLNKEMIDLSIPKDELKTVKVPDIRTLKSSASALGLAEVPLSSDTFKSLWNLNVTLFSIENTSTDTEFSLPDVTIHLNELEKIIKVPPASLAPLLCFVE